MFKFNKYQISIISALIPLSFICSEAGAGTLSYKESPLPIIQSGHIYVGAFGGGGQSSNNSLTQTGTAFFPASSGGPLAVHAEGHGNNDAASIGGLHAGYEWAGLISQSVPTWNVIPAVEVEGYYLGIRQKGILINPTTRLPEHDFHDTFPMNTGVILANTVWTVQFPKTTWVNLYVGAGIGASAISISSANSAQVSPPEPGINHFNSNTSASNWAFAAQAKAGLRFVLTPHWRLFGEYRFLYVSSSNYTFGSTQYTTHVPTTNWNVNLSSTNYNMGAAGIEYVF